MPWPTALVASSSYATASTKRTLRRYIGQQEQIHQPHGESRDGTILTSSTDRGSAHPQNNYTDCAALNVFVKKFYAENLTIRNTAGNVGQAEALYTAGDAHIFNNCKISGFQDTYKSNSGSRGYFYNCLIEGATDFIYDSGLEWFENCTINCLPGGSYITAAADASLKMTQVLYPQLSDATFYAGLFFNRCHITAADGVANNSYYLGRPWKEMCGTAFINCTLGSHIKSAGWATWNGTENTASYYEYNNVDTEGNPVDVSQRVAWSHQATQAEYDAYFNTTFLYKAQNPNELFDPESLLAGIKAPGRATISGKELSWEAVDNGSRIYGYAQRQDGSLYHRNRLRGRRQHGCMERESRIATRYHQPSHLVQGSSHGLPYGRGIRQVCLRRPRR